MTRPLFRRFSGFAAPLPLPAFSAQSAPAASVGSAYSYAFVADSGPTYSLGSGTLPAGLTLSSGGVLSGTPTTAAVYTFQVRATNSSGSTLSTSQSVTVSLPLPTFTAQAAPAGMVGSAYSYTFVAGPGNPTFALGTGSLPVGLTLSSGGVLSGTPTTNATYTFTVVATNATGPATSSGQSVTIAVAGQTQQVWWDPAAFSAAGGPVGTITGFNMKLDTQSRAQGGTYATSQFVSGANTGTGTFLGLSSGVPYFYTVVATDGTNESLADFEGTFTL